MLVIPNRHAARLADLDAADGMHLFQVSQRIAAAQYASGLPCEGVNFFLADGPAARQDVFHVHLHVIPRSAADGVQPAFMEHYNEESPARSALDLVAEQIRAVFLPLENPASQAEGR